ncbi:MAG TPA: response regulator transcription factor [Opitutaceae bacterium]|jgi:DNA-binding NarL/FixJ family response regulator|nr:response regulator transcription factor [Opitutaceae bacterium]
MGNPVRIFLVDDHPLVREWLSALLRQQPDFTVVGTAEDPGSALAGVAAAKPDVAIVDLSLKTGSGLDLIKDLKARFPAVAVLVLSMYEEIYYAERALRAGALGYVTKRESTARVVEAVRQVLSGRVYASPELMARLAERMVGRPTPPAQGAMAILSDREIEVFQRLGLGHPTRKIATDLKVSIKTVQAYCARIKEKLGIGSGTELMREAVRWVESENRRSPEPKP